MGWSCASILDYRPTRTPTHIHTPTPSPNTDTITSGRYVSSVTPRTHPPVSTNYNLVLIILYCMQTRPIFTHKKLCFENIPCILVLYVTQRH